MSVRRPKAPMDEGAVDVKIGGKLVTNTDIVRRRAISVSS